MKIEISTLYWPNTPAGQIQAHKSVIDHFELPITYYEEKVRHGRWMDRICRSSKSDIIVFFDSDCVPLNKEKVSEAIDYAAKNDTFLGIAQVSNHVLPRAHIFAAPAFYVITKSCYERLGQPSFSETRRSDVAEELTYAAEAKGVRYRCLYPTHFEKEPVGGVWPLGNYGYYGIGTVFDETVYHLYQGRLGNNIDLFVERCNQIIDGSFTTSAFYDSKTYHYEGGIASDSYVSRLTEYKIYRLGYLTILHHY
jgi:hypothetical protein